MTDQLNQPVPYHARLMQIAYEELKEEHRRIDELIRLNRPDNQPHPLEPHAVTIYNKFANQVARVGTALDDLGLYLQAEDYAKAWGEYTRLRKELMPPLSNELLAVLGGLYLLKEKLENMPGTRESEQGLSFTTYARNLVTEMADNSATEWASVLIVGEEQLSHSEAEVIRLRFPACDLWSLPLTAHEYGFLVAHKSKAQRFNDLLIDVRRKIDPSEHIQAGPPDYSDCYLEEITHMWEAYHRDSDKAAFLKQHEKEITQLKKRQEAHLRRIFADAFATFVAGPAYVLALIHLRIMPDESLRNPREALPATDVRLMTCLEILSWMNSEPVLVSRLQDSRPFKLMVEDVSTNQRNIPKLWQETMQSFDLGSGSQEHSERYNHLRGKYKAWLDVIKLDLKESFAKAIQRSYQNWFDARSLKDFFLTKSQEKTSASMLTILNAAWLARLEEHTKMGTIQDLALKMLAIGSRAGAGEIPGSPSTVDAARAALEDKKRRDIEFVEKALENDPWELGQFNQMKANRDFSGPNMTSLLQHFTNTTNRAAYEALIRLRDGTS
jgi:hypothetical protein